MKVINTETAELLPASCSVLRAESEIIDWDIFTFIKE